MDQTPISHLTPLSILEEMAAADRLAEAVQVLETLAAASGVSFDRMAARQVLEDAAGAHQGDDAVAWSRRLVEVGDSVGLRVRRVECRFDEAMAFLRQDIPVVAWVDDLEGEFRWWVLARVCGPKIEVFDIRSGKTSFLSPIKVRRLLRLSRRNATAPWILAQAALPHSAPHEHEDEAAHGGAAHGHHGPPPTARLWSLIVSERRDITAILVFAVAVGILALATPIAVEALVNSVAFGRYVQPLVVLAILLFTFLAFSAALRTLSTYVIEVLQRRLFVRMVEDLAYRLPRVRQESLDGHHGPELVNRFFDIVTVQKAAASLLLDGVGLALQTAIGMVVLAFYHPFLLGFDVFLLCFIAFVIFGLGRGAACTSIRESKAKYAVAAWLQELARHPSAFKLNGGLTLALERADQLAIDYLDARRRHFRILLRQIVFALGLQVIAATVLLGLGGWLVVRGQLTLGQLVAAELIVMVIVGAFAKVGKHLETFYDLLASMDKLGHLFDLPPEPQDKLFHLSDVSPASLEVRAVSYRYPSGNVGLEEFHLHVASGERVAVMGPAGSGKSTLVDLICGVRPPSSGHVELDGIDLREIRPDSLREHLGVTRGVEIFAGTIGENVRLNRPHVNARDVRDALDAVGLLDEALRLPDGLDAKLATGGAPLSSTQAIRLAVARAIVSRPRLLVIDGLLDALPDEMLDAVLDHLLADSAPWTVILTTGRRRVAERSGRVVRLGESAAALTAAPGGGSDSAGFNDIAFSPCR